MEKMKENLKVQFPETGKDVLDELREDDAVNQKYGIHFMLASIPIWIGICIVHTMPLSVINQNLCVFCFSALLVPLAYMIAKLLHIKFRYDENPLSKLGLLFTCNQILYILIAMWAYGQASDHFLMIYAMIFGGHLMPFSWLYKCKSYMVSSIVVSIGCLAFGCIFGAMAVAVFMLFHQILFSVILWKQYEKIK